MLGLYLDTLIYDQNCYNMLSTQNNLSLQRELQNSANIMCFGQTSKTQQLQNRKSNMTILARAGNETRDLSNPSRMPYLKTTVLP